MCALLHGGRTSTRSILRSGWRGIGFAPGTLRSRQGFTAWVGGLAKGESGLVMNFGLVGEGASLDMKGLRFGHCAAWDFVGGSSLVRGGEDSVSCGQDPVGHGQDSVDDGQSLLRDGQDLFVWEETLSMTDKTQSVTDRVFSMMDKPLSATDKTRSMTDQTASMTDKTLSAAKKAVCRAENPVSATFSTLSGRLEAFSETMQPQSNNPTNRPPWQKYPLPGMELTAKANPCAGTQA